MLKEHAKPFLWYASLEELKLDIIALELIPSALHQSEVSQTFLDNSTSNIVMQPRRHYVHFLALRVTPQQIVSCIEPEITAAPSAKESQTTIAHDSKRSRNSMSRQTNNLRLTRSTPKRE